MSLEIKYQERNAIASKWGRDTRKDIISEAKGLGVGVYSGRYYKQFRQRTYKSRGVVYAIAFNMIRHMVYVEKGVGRGYPIEVAQGRSLGQTKNKIAGTLRGKGYNKTAILMYLKNAGKRNPLEGKP